jgi:hypothetical protein
MVPGACGLGSSPSAKGAETTGFGGSFGFSFLDYSQSANAIVPGG